MAETKELELLLRQEQTTLQAQARVCKGEERSAKFERLSEIGKQLKAISQKKETSADLEFRASTWQRYRQMARTSLLYLCGYVLGYKDVTWQVHGPIIDALQHFKGGHEDCEQIDRDRFTLKVGSYQPACPLYDLKGSRQNLFLYPRYHLKTSVITIAHSIQWNINYPDIRIRLHSAMTKQVQGFLREIKGHYVGNGTFRYLFPEYCPRLSKSGKMEDFGNDEFFEVPCRTARKKEPTVSISTAESVLSSTHHDVGKIDDLVDLLNSRTANELERIKQNLSMFEPLIERYNNGTRGWKDIAGTIYSFSDAHYTIWKDEEKKPEQERMWQVVARSAAPNYPEGPTLWPQRCSIDDLRNMENDPSQGPEMLYSQMLMNPRPDKSGLISSKDDIRWIPRDKWDGLKAYLSLHVTVDLNGMEPMKPGADNDFACVNLHGFGRDGRLYIGPDLLYSREVTPDDVIEYLFYLKAMHPQIVDFKIEKEAHARVLLPFLKREMAKRQVWLPIIEIKRDNQTSKQQRIKGLQPWFINGTITFVEGLGYKNKKDEWVSAKPYVEDEILFFPKYVHDDFLDTTADAMQNRDGAVTSEVMPMPKHDEVLSPWKAAGQVNGEMKWTHYGSMPVAFAQAMWDQESEL